jgi:hypothetical protein
MPANLKAANTPRPGVSPTPQANPFQIDGPFAWGDLGTCFTFNDKSVETDFKSKPISFSWKMDEGTWSAFSITEAVKCFQDLAKGSHIVTVKFKDVAGKERGQTSLSFVQ